MKRKFEKNLKRREGIYTIIPRLMRRVNRLRKITIALILSFSSLPVFSQELPIIHYGVKEGLNSVNINSLTQGPDGRLWIAHQAGVSVYDGYNFLNWTKYDGLLESSPSTILMDDSGILWITFPYSGLQYLDANGKIHTVPDPEGRYQDDRIALLFKLKDGSILASGRNGYYQVSRLGISGPFYPVEGEAGGVSTIKEIENESGFILACTDGVFRIQGEESVHFDLPDDIVGDRMILDIVPGDQQDLWFLIRGGILLRKIEDRFEHWKLPEIKDRANYTLFGMCRDQEGNIWIASGSGLYRWSLGRFERFTEDQGISSIWINSILVDRDGILWLATEGGLDKISYPAFRNYTYRKDFPVNSVWAIDEHPSGDTWIGTNSGIIIIQKNGEYRTITEREGLPENNIIDLKIRPNGDVWILGYSNVYLRRGNRFISFPYPPFEKIGLYGLLPVSEKEIWICTSEGIYSLNPQTRSISNHPVTEKIKDNPAVVSLFRHSNGDIYIMGKSLFRYRPDSSLEQIEPPSWADNQSIFKILENGDRLWMLCDSGLISWDGESWNNHLDPGKNVTYFDMVQINEREFWLGCNTGIAKYDGANYHYFGYHDGVAVEECNLGACMRDSQGRIWLGGKNITIVRDSLIRQFPPAKPLITSVTVENTEYRFPQAISFSSRVRGVIFHFASPSFYNEQDQLFRFRMTGLDDIWSNPEREHTIRYANLPPGRYTFEVQSRQKFGDWGLAVARTKVRVSPPFWQTLIAKILLVAVILIAGSTGSIFQVKRLKKQQLRLKNLIDSQTKEIRKQRDRLAELATIDELTGLPNRRKFEEIMDNEIARCRRYERSLALGLFDIDFFKNINDTYGHVTGDKGLRHVAQIAVNQIRETDMFARWGGDEFILLIPECNEEEALSICKRICAAIKQKSYISSREKPLELTLSGGTVVWQCGRDPDLTSEQIFHAADQTLYLAKSTGRDKVLLYDHKNLNPSWE